MGDSETIIIEPSAVATMFHYDASARCSESSPLFGSPFVDCELTPCAGGFCELALVTPGAQHAGKDCTSARISSFPATHTSI